MEGFNNGGQVPAYGSKKTAQQVITGLKEQLKEEKARSQKLLNALYDIENWDENKEDYWDDPAERAADAIQKYLKSTL